MARLRDERGRFLPNPNKETIQRPESPRPGRLRDENGRFISGFKEKIIREMAARNNAPDAAQFLRENIKELTGFIHDNKTSYAFNESNLEDALRSKQITVNGERETYGRAMMRTQEFVTFMRTNFEAAAIVFNSQLKNERGGGKNKKDNWNGIDITLPDVERMREMLKNGATIEEIIDYLAEFEIDVYLSEKK